MTSRDFCYWLQGFFELTDTDKTVPIVLTRDKVECIKQHLALVFKHEIDPSFGDEEIQKALNKIHDGNAIVRC